MAKIKGESELTFMEAASIIVGHGVGAGILSVPYLAAHNSFRETVLILLIGYDVALVLHTATIQGTCRTLSTLHKTLIVTGFIRPYRVRKITGII